MSDMTGIILAAGKGSRMQPFSDVCPKSALPIMGKPIVVHQLEMMQQLGIERVLIVVGHLGYQLVSAVSRYPIAGGMQIDYVDQKETLGIAHALGTLESRVDGATLMFLGDIYFITDRLAEMVRMYDDPAVGAVLAAKVEQDPKAVSRNFAIYENDAGFVMRVIERRWNIDFAEYFRVELEALEQPVGHGFVELTDDTIDVVGHGKLFIRNVCMIFDAYMAAKTGERPMFSRTV